MKKVLLFDFDGVIVDSFALSYASSKASSQKEFSVEEYKNWFEGNIYSQFEPNEQKRKVPTAQDSFFVEYIPRLLAQPPLEGMKEVLTALAKNYRLVIVTSTINSPVQEYLDQYNLATEFDTVLGGDVHTSKIVKIQMAMELYAVTADDCLFITDTLGDMREATKVGVAAIGVSWGFHDTARLVLGQPLAIATTPTELQQLIETTP